MTWLAALTVHENPMLPLILLAATVLALVLTGFARRRRARAKAVASGTLAYLEEAIVEATRSGGVPFRPPSGGLGLRLN